MEQVRKRVEHGDSARRGGLALQFGISSSDRVLEFATSHSNIITVQRGERWIWMQRSVRHLVSSAYKYIHNTPGRLAPV